MSKGLLGALIAVIVVFVVGIVGLNIFSAVHTATQTCTVTEKDRTKDSNGRSDARVYTSDCGTLRVADSLLDGTWSSSDTYAKIQPGQTYTFKTRGLRVPFFSMFPNIVSVS